MDRFNSTDYEDEDDDNEDSDTEAETMKCVSCKEDYEPCDAGTCRECYEEASETEEELRRQIEDLKSKVNFLRFSSAATPISFTDVVLVASDDRSFPQPVPVPAHRAVLASRSPVFRAMLENKMEESLSGTIKISDVSYDALRTFVNYLYNAEAACLDENTACNLLILAEKYQVKHLKNYCEKFLISELQWENSIPTYAFAHQHRANNLLASALALILENMPKLCKGQEYKELVEKDPRMVVEIYEAYLSSYAGRLFVNGSSKPMEILSKLNELAGFAPDEEIKLFEVARDEDLVEQIGRNVYFDLVDHDKVRRFSIQKQMPFGVLKEEVAKEFGIPVHCQRFWLWAKRQNHTYRPNRTLTPHEEAQSVGKLREVSNETNNSELKLFLEVERGQDLQPVPLPETNKDEILLFFKLYDPSKEELRYAGRLFVNGSSKPIEILSKLNELAGFAPDEEIELFEEIKFEPNVMCERIEKRLTFRSSQLQNGDIVCFQKSLHGQNIEQFRYPDVPSFLEFVHNRLVVHFRPLEKPKEDEFCLELSKQSTYDDVVECIARHLSLDDPSKIRLTPHNCYSQQPKPQYIKYRGVDRLTDMLVHYNQSTDILYYEVLDIPLPELQGLKTLKVAFHHATKDEVVTHMIRLPKQGFVGDVLNDLKTKVELSHPDAELRLLEVFYNKIYKIFPLHEKIENINDQYWTLRAEEIPEEEKNLGPNDRVIHVYHFVKDTAQNSGQIHNFGEPFFLVIHEAETLADIKLRIQKKLRVPDDEFSKWKIAFLSMGRPEYLDDTDIVATHFQRRDVYGAWEQYLGLEHSDSTSRRSYAANQNRHTFDKPVKIYN